MIKVTSQLASIKAGVLKNIMDSITKLPNGIAIGYNALNNFDSIAFNSSNIALGQNAGVGLTEKTSGISNADNILIGQNAAASINASGTNTGAYQNIMIGNGAGQNTNSLASQNVVIGYEAAKNSSGIIGTQTTVFNNNIAIGARSLSSAIISQSNVSIGSDNMNATTQANRNTMIGSNAVNKYNGDDNVIIGAEMLIDTASNGSKNVIIGSSVAKNIRGSKNIILGYKAAYDSSFKNTNNKLIIANDSTRTPLIYGEFDYKKITINGDLTVTGRLNGANGSSVSDSTIKLLNKRIDSLVTAISTKNYGRIDSSTLFTANPIIVNKFLDSTFLPSINFDGNKTYVQIGATGLLGTRIFGTNFSVETWLKSFKVNDTIQYIYGTGYSWNGGSGNFKIGLYKGRVLVEVGNFSGYKLSCEYPKDSLWHHVAFMHDNQNKIGIIYIDGIEKGRLTNLGSQNMANGTSGVEGIGANLDLGGEPPREFFKGNIRKIRVSKGLVYKASFTPSFTYTKADSTLAFWELNDLGTRIKASDSAYNGTLYNGAWYIKDTISGSVTVTTSVIDTLFNSPISVNGNVTSNNGDSIIQKGMLFGTSSDLQLTGANQVNSYYPAPYPVDTITYKWVMDYTNGGFKNSVPMTGTPQFPQNNNGYILSLAGQGSFNIKILGTFGQTNYYVRAFAKTKNGVFYGNSVKVKTSNYSRDLSQRADFANVFWDNKFSLFDLLTDELILPDINGNYNIWYSTNENPTVNSITLSSKNPISYVYKFKTKESCQRWCDYRTGKIKP